MGLVPPEGGGSWGLDSLSDASRLVLEVLGTQGDDHVGLLGGCWDPLQCLPPKCASSLPQALLPLPATLWAKLSPAAPQVGAAPHLPPKSPWMCQRSSSLPSGTHSLHIAAGPLLLLRN